MKFKPRAGNEPEGEKSRNIAVIDVMRLREQQALAALNDGCAFQRSVDSALARPTTIQRSVLHEQVGTIQSACGVRDEVSAVNGSAFKLAFRTSSQ